MDLSILQSLDELEASQLRSILLFENYKRDEEENSLLRKRVLLSIIVSGKGRYDENSLKEILRTNFALEWNEKLQGALHGLLSNQIVLKGKDGCLSVNTEDEKGTAFFETLEKRTNTLIQNIYSKYMAYQPSFTDKQTILHYIRKVLSIYYKISGYSFFDVQKKDTSYNSVIDSLNGLDKQTKSCLASAIGETLEKPTEQESTTLEIWAKAFVVTQMTRLDPMLTNFRQDQLRKKSFVLDTDFVLYALTSEATYSKEYRSILDYIKRLGCKIYIPKEVRKETLGCIKEAESIMDTYGEQTMISYGEDYSFYTKRNVFVEDFIRLRQSETNKNLSFSVYLRNIFDREHPVIFDEKLRGLIGSENFDRELDYVELDNDLQEKLMAQILVLTNDSEKGQERTFEFNLKVSENDARLYLTLKKLNQDNADTGSWSSKYYLLTRTTKTIHCAKNLNIYTEDVICNPQALTSVLQELGDIQNETKLIDLFDNPFLAYVATITWEKASPLMKEGVRLEHVDLVTMRVDVNEGFDDVLTSTTKDELQAMAKKYEGKGYQFTKRWVAIVDDKEKLTRANEEKDAKIEALSKKVARLEQQLGKQRYESRIGNSPLLKFKRRKKK